VLGITDMALILIHPPCCVIYNEVLLDCRIATNVKSRVHITVLSIIQILQKRRGSQMLGLTSDVEKHR
jgi:hypothetical protein